MDRSDPKQLTTWLVRAITYVVYAYLVITEIILIQGFLLKLLGANPKSSYVAWSYRSLEPIMEPFRGIFKTIDLNENSVLDTSIIFAMFIYGLLALVVNSFLGWLTYHLVRIERERRQEEARALADASESAYAARYSAVASEMSASSYPPPERAGYPVEVSTPADPAFVEPAGGGARVQPPSGPGEPY